MYDFPILYFPKFFHPDPSVKRQSGFLRPQINNSNELRLIACALLSCDI